MFGELRNEIGPILRKLCEMKEVVLIEGNIRPDHVHMYLSIPPKLSVSDFMSYLKGKSALMIFDKHPEYTPRYAARHFWARGYYCSLSRYRHKSTYTDRIIMPTISA